jgi:hypothetical protein
MTDFIKAMGLSSAFNGVSLDSAGPDDQVELPSNTFVSNPLIVNSLKDGAENSIIPGQLFFFWGKGLTIQVSQDKKIASHTVVTLPHLNKILSDCWSKISTANLRGDANAVKFMDILQNFSEMTIANYMHLKQYPEDKPKYDEEEPEEQEDDDLKFLFGLCQKDPNYALCICPQMILREFRFGGVTYNRQAGFEKQVHTAADCTKTLLILNTISSHLAEVHNVFGPNDQIQVGSSLYIHLYRKRLADNNYGPFVAEPIACAYFTRPCIMNTYRDFSNRASSGCLIEIGSIHFNEVRSDSEVTKQKASGFSPSPDLDHAKRATARLSKITINLLHN